MQRTQVATSREIQRRTGKTFYLATRFLPRRIRHETHVLYAFFRVADEIVDAPGDRTAEEQTAGLERLRARVLDRSVPRDPAVSTDRDSSDDPFDSGTLSRYAAPMDSADPVIDAFREVATRRSIPDAEVDRFLDSMLADVHTDRYETMAELEAYMRGSAGAVGVMMTAIMRPDDPETALPHAIALGEAFQLTNFLRDVREDVLELDRIYLPAETLESHGATRDQVEQLEPSSGVRSAIQELLVHTEQRYRHGVAGIQYLPPDCRFPVLLAAVLYAEHHRRIRGRTFDVLTAPPTLARRHKLWALCRTRWHWTWNRDPSAVFERASSLPPPSATGHRLDTGDSVLSQS